MSAIKTTIKIILLFLAGLIVGSLCAGFSSKAQDKSTESDRIMQNIQSGRATDNMPVYKMPNIQDFGNSIVYDYPVFRMTAKTYKVSMYNDKGELSKQVTRCKNIKTQNDSIGIEIETLGNKVVIEQE